MIYKTGSYDTVARHDLGIVVKEYMDSLDGFAANEIFPVFNATKSEGSYSVVPIEAMMDIEPDDTRGLYGSYNFDDFELEKGFYTTADRGLSARIDKTELDIINEKVPGFDYEAMKIKRKVDQLVRGREKRVADLTFNATKFATSKITITNEWDDSTNAVPVDDIRGGKRTFRSQLGVDPDALIITEYTFEALKGCAQIRDSIKYTYPMINMEQMSKEQLAQALGVKKIIVPKGYYNTKNPGNFTLGEIWNKEYAALVKLDNSQAMIEPCIGRTFVWTETWNGTAIPLVEQYYDDRTKTWYYDISQNLNEEYIASYTSAKVIQSDISVRSVVLFDNVSTI